MPNVIRSLMDSQGQKPTPFARAIGIPTSTMFSIYRGEVAEPRIAMDTFVKIAHGLGMSSDELHARCVGSASGAGPELSPDERLVVGSMRLTDERGRRTIRRAAEGAVEDYLLEGGGKP